MWCAPAACGLCSTQDKGNVDGAPTAQVLRGSDAHRADILLIIMTWVDYGKSGAANVMDIERRHYNVLCPCIAT